MLVGSACFDPHTTIEGGGGGGGLAGAEDGFSQTNFSMEGHSFHHQNLSSHQHQQDAALAMPMDMEFQHQLNMEMEQSYNNSIKMAQDQSNRGWEEHMNLNYSTNQQQQVEIQNFTVPLPDSTETTTHYPPTPDLLNMLPLPRCSPSSLLPNSSTTQKSPSNLLSSLGLLGDLSSSAAAHDGTTTASSVVYDPLLPLNLSPQPPFFRELMIHSLPHGYSLGGSRSGSLFSGVDDGEASGGGFFQDGDGRSYDNGVFEFTAGINCLAKGREGKDTKHFATEKQRRIQLNDKYNALRNLVPNPTKNDRASVVGDAIDYINELKRTVGELKILVEKKRCSRERIKRQKAENGSVLKTENDHLDQPYHGSELRSSWLHRKSRNTEVDVRIIDDEVTVKLVQQKRINCLLFVSKALDELQLDLHHVAGGLIGDYYSFLINSKISEGSTVYAHAIANKLIDVVDKQYAAFQPTSSY